MWGWQPGRYFGSLVQDLKRAPPVRGSLAGSSRDRRARRGRVLRGEAAYRVKRSTPRADDNTSVLLDSVTVLSPLSSFVYVLSNSIVGHAARVHASAGPAVRVWPDSVNPPPHTLQSARVDSLPSAKVNV